MTIKIETKKLRIVDVTGRGALRCQYPGQQQPQPVFAELDLETGELSTRYNPEIGNGVPMNVWNNRSMRFYFAGIPTVARANAAMREVAPLAQRVLDGASVVWNGSNYVGRLTDAAEDAAEEIEKRLLS
jgi:hypothetical protein